MRYTIQTVLAITALFAWGISVSMPGGRYILLPIGTGVVLLISCITSVCILLRSQPIGTWRALQFGISLLLLIGLLIIFPPFWSHAAYFARHEREVADKRTHILCSMPAEVVRDDGRRLLEHMTENAVQNLFPSAHIVPESLRALDPLYVEARGDHLLVVLGKGPESYYLMIYTEGAHGRGTKRLCKGLWFFLPGKTRWITDSEWDDGARQ